MGRTRITVLQSNGKMFNRNVFAILSSVKAREEGRNNKPSDHHHHHHSMSMRPGIPAPAQPPMPYNRYGQEQFKAADTEGFNIDTTRTYTGESLKSMMTGGNNPKRTPVPHPQVPRPAVTAVAKVIPQPSLITMYNVQDILQDLKFVSTEEKRAAGMKRENDVLIQRRKEGGFTVPYRVMD